MYNINYQSECICRPLQNHYVNTKRFLILDLLLLTTHSLLSNNASLSNGVLILGFCSYGSVMKQNGRLYTDNMTKMLVVIVN